MPKSVEIHGSVLVSVDVHGNILVGTLIDIIRFVVTCKKFSKEFTKLIKFGIVGK